MANVMKLPTGAIIQEVNLKNLHVDETYQRPLNKSYVGQLKRRFDLAAVRMPCLSWRDRRWNIIDGQHTVQLLVWLEHFSWFCECFYGFDRIKEAEVYYLRNTGANIVKGWMRFRAAVAAGRLVETTILKIIHEYNLRPKMDLDDGPVDFTTSSVLVQIFEEKKEDHFRNLVAVLAKSFRQDKKNHHLQEEAKKTEFIRGLSSFLNQHPEVTYHKFINKINRNNGWTAGTIVDQANTAAGQHRRFRSLDSHITSVLEQAFGLACADPRRLKIAS